MKKGNGLCDVCKGAQPIYRQVYSGVSFCDSCFKKSVEKRVRKTISRYSLLREDDRILVAVSGGKDSLSLLKILAKIEKTYPRASLVAVSIDEGIPGYRDEALRLAADMCRRLGVEHRVYTFEDLFGVGLTEAMSRGILSRLGLGACSLCGVWRRKAISLAARELKATVVATAHTLDDIVQTYLMDILRGEFPKAPIGLRREGNGIIPRVAPLRLIPEEEVVLYAYLSRVPFQETPCPNAQNSQRDLVRTFLAQFESRYPGSLFAALKTIESRIVPREEALTPCQVCGEPASKTICRACELESQVSRLSGEMGQLVRANIGVDDV
ncbi:tRNA 2-thiocytidine biosynthesis protein TtcA [Candidatus Calditenuaceae archaeon HR02]|nr:tRNA 2-thiocytidine biosynthesis protein TtcA [Candidatus Calditenuaceae archaeon HR02]